MKTKSLFFAIPLILALSSCENGTTGYYVPGSSLAEKLEWLKMNAYSGDSYTLDISADETIIPNQKLEYTGRTNVTITLRGSGENRTINLASDGNMFVVRSGVTLVLESNITLRGRRFNPSSLVYVSSGGELRMNTGAAIIDNTAQNSTGGGVLVEGTFTMNGGTISGNATASDGGAVAMAGGTFNMNGGTISGNGANNDGGAVAILGKGNFIMSGGTISGNSASDGGGGVAVKYGNFTMSGGTISGNNAGKDGGGVYSSNVRHSTGHVLGIGNFTMSGGTISGNTTRSDGGGVGINNAGSFVMNRGSITGNTGIRGGGVSVAANTTFTMSGGTISGNTARNSGGGVLVEGEFAKTGGSISGYNSDRMGNVVSNTLGAVEYEKGHAVYAYYSGLRVTKRKEATAGSGVNLFFTDRTGSFSGEWDY